MLSQLDPASQVSSLVTRAGELPAPLQPQVGVLEWQVRPAPGGRGTELVFRP